MNEIYLYLGLGALLVIIVAVIISKNTKAKLSKRGFEIETKEGKDNVIIKDIKSESDVDVNTKQGQNLNIQEKCKHVCARKRCQMARGRAERRLHKVCQWPLSQAARAFAVWTAPVTVHCAPGNLRRWETICLQALSTVPLPII